MIYYESVFDFAYRGSCKEGLLKVDPQWREQKKGQGALEMRVLGEGRTGLWSVTLFPQEVLK